MAQYAFAQVFGNNFPPVGTTCAFPIQLLLDSAWIRVLGVITNDEKEIADQKKEEQLSV